jgi:hypothetical protein
MLLLFLALMLSLNVCGKAVGQDAPPAPEIQQTGPHNTITLRAVGTPGHYTGFDLIADDLLVAPVRFTSHDLIWCAKAAATKNGLTSALVFDDVQADPACGLRLEHSHITVTLQSERYPTVAFDLHIAAFDPVSWQQTLGVQPFHFLTLAMPDATVWHQEGWLFATPRADLFPLLLDPHDGAAALSASYNREWSRTPPLSAHALPVIGLWSPARKSYAAWDFQATRLSPNASEDYLEGHSERDIATGFCNRLIVSTDPTLPQTQETVPASAPPLEEDTPQSKNGLPPLKRDPRTRKPLTYMEQASREYDQRGVSKFVALVSPGGGVDGRQLVYPKPGTRLASQAVLTFSTDLPDTDDPNRFLWQQWWNTPDIYSSLPHVPRVVDTGGLSVALRPQTLTAAPDGSPIVRAEAGPYLPGSLVLSGQDRQDTSVVNVPARHDDAARLARLQADASTLLKYAHRFQVDKEPCVYWNNPLAGEWTPASGGEPAATLHNAQGWAAARMLLELYRAEREKARQQNQKSDKEPENSSAPDIARNPKSKVQNPKTIDGVFNWTKHMVWMRGGFEGGPAIPTAKDNTLAAAFLLDYYFTFKDDPLDGEHRTRALLALGLARSFTYRAMILRAGDAAGDPLEEAFQWTSRAGIPGADEDKEGDIAGNLDMLAQVAVHTGDPILLWALQGSVSRLSRTQQPGTPGGEMIVPPANADVQALCGEEAALAFDRNHDNKHDNIVITSYRCTRTGDFAFTLHRVKPTGISSAVNTPICANITFPYADLSLKPVAVRRGNVQQRVLRPGAELARDPRALWSLHVSGLRDGDTVIVGSPELNGAEKLPCAPPLLEVVARPAKNTDARPAVPLAPPSPASLSKITGALRKQDETKRRPARP